EGRSPAADLPRRRCHVGRPRHSEIYRQEAAVIGARASESHVHMTSNRSTTLARLLAAIVADEALAVRLVRAKPEIELARVRQDRLVKEVPNKLYVRDTALHIAAAALRPLAVEALIKAGADGNAENRRGATALHYACDPRPKAGRTWNPSKQRSVIELLL